MKYRVRFAYLDAKPTCPFRARTQTPARNFPETKTILVHVRKSEESSDTRSKRLHPLISPEFSVVDTPLPQVFLSVLPPDYKLFFYLGGRGRGKNQPNYIQIKVLFVCN